MKELANIILNEKIQQRINHINTHGARNFDRKCDTINFSLTPKQFYIIKKHYKLNENYVLCCGIRIDKFSFGDYEISSKYNDRKNYYELCAKHKDFIEDLDKRLDYFEETY